VPFAEAVGVEDAFYGFGAGKNSGGGEFVFFSDAYDFLNAFGAKLRSDGSGCREVAGG
jgi:hypothetical protein